MDSPSPCSSRRGSYTPVTSSSAASTSLGNTKVSDLKLILVNAVVAGLEIASSVAFTFIPPLLLKSGYSETQMTIIFGVAPLIALFTVPTLGHWSDLCTSKWGRRRPFIFVLSLFLIFSLVLLCFGQTMVTNDKHQNTGMCIVAFAVVSLDYASQAAINPCEALMADILQSSPNANTGFMIYSAMLSLGSCVGYLLSAVDWQSLIEPNYLSSEQTAILIVLILFSITLFITMATAHERPCIKKLSNGSTIVNGDIENNFKNNDSETASLLLNNNIGRTTSSSASGMKKSSTNSINVMTIQSSSITNFKKFLLNSCRISFILACLIKAVTNCILAIVKPLRTIYEAPMVLQRLFWADLLCWMALMAHSMFCTDYVATVVYGGSAYAERGSIEDIRFDEGVRMGSVGLLLHSTTACLFSSFVQDSMANLVGNKVLYISGLALFGVSMFFTVIFPSVVVLNVCAAFSGLGFAVATTIPCTLITKYHEQPEIFFRDTRTTVQSSTSGSGSTNEMTTTISLQNGVGGDMAVLDSTYYLSQIILSLFMGKLVEATGLPHFYIAIASCCGFLSALMATRVAFTPADYNRALKT